MMKVIRSLTVRDNLANQLLLRCPGNFSSLGHGERRPGSLCSAGSAWRRDETRFSPVKPVKSPVSTSFIPASLLPLLLFLFLREGAGVTTNHQVHPGLSEDPFRNVRNPFALVKQRNPFWTV